MKTRDQSSNSAPRGTSLDPGLLERARLHSTATLHEAAGQKGALPAAIKPIGKNGSLCGSVFTVQLEPGDNLALHAAIYEAGPGKVLVVATAGYFEAGYWGEILSTAAIKRGLGGLVLDGCVRDGAALASQNFPVFARGLCIQGTTKKSAGALNSPIVIGEVVIKPDDLVLGDMDGVVIITRDSVNEVVLQSDRRARDELGILERVAAGARTLDELGLSNGPAGTIS